MRRKKMVKINNDKIRSKITIENSNNGLLLTIMIPTLFSRKQIFNSISNKLVKQIKENNLDKIVEILAIYDNKTMSLSFKRNALVSLSGGKFIISLDDDDDIADDYIITLYNTIKDNLDCDVITFNQNCNCDGKIFNVMPCLNSGMKLNKISDNNFSRYPWIWCAWKREKVKDILYEDENKNKINYGEDKMWLQKVKQSGNITKEVKINKTLHYYRFNSKLSETA